MSNKKEPSSFYLIHSFNAFKHSKFALYLTDELGSHQSCTEHDPIIEQLRFNNFACRLIV
ncbi:MAG: hypothetical protein AAF487_05390 [Bacteroidota bacterium]